MAAPLGLFSCSICFTREMETVGWSIRITFECGKLAREGSEPGAVILVQCDRAVPGAITGAPGLAQASRFCTRSPARRGRRQSVTCPLSTACSTSTGPGQVGGRGLHLVQTNWPHGGCWHSRRKTSFLGGGRDSDHECLEKGGSQRPLSLQAKPSTVQINAAPQCPGPTGF